MPLGYALTITNDAVSSCIYVQSTPGVLNTPGALAAGAAVTLGPFNNAREYEINYLGNAPVLESSQSGMYTGDDDAALALKAPLLSPALTGSPTIAKVNGTESGNAVTTNGACGRITTSALTTAAGASYSITWTNSSITASSAIILTHAGGTNTKFVNLKVVAGSGTATLSINNIDLLAALNGTVLINYVIL